MRFPAKSYGLAWFVIGVVVSFGSSVHAAGYGELTREWVINRLQIEIAEEQPDLNAISSLLYPLTSTTSQFSHPDVRAVLTRIVNYLTTLNPERLECGQLADLKLSAGFLAEAKIVFDTSEAEKMLSECNLAGTLFDTVNALIFYCRYSDDEHLQKLPGALESVERAQLPNGSFAWERGRPWFYLTSHAVLALYYCGGEAHQLHRGQQRLLQLLPLFYQSGFIDGLAESMIFLRWMNIPVSKYQHYLAYIRSRTLPDGGVCFVDRPGCVANWHATSLLLELQNLERRE